jgi:putative Mg2+ transporter-C (MgtC) family protein
LRDGLTVKGMNTAATLWCTAAVGTLAGAGFPFQSLIGTVTVLGLHLSLRPLARRIDARVQTSVDVETLYQFRVSCRETHEGVIRTILLRHISAIPGMMIQRISTQEIGEDGQASVVADVYSIDRKDRAIQDVMSRLNIESDVRSVSWEKIQN